MKTCLRWFTGLRERISRTDTRKKTNYHTVFYFFSAHTSLSKCVQYFDYLLSKPTVNMTNPSTDIDV